jgi:hypothetical protein
MDDFKNLADVSIEHRQLVEAMKDRLLIALIRKLGGTVVLSSRELDEALQLDLAFKLSGSVFTFAARWK